jgi:hypothetical protein
MALGLEDIQKQVKTSSDSIQFDLGQVAIEKLDLKSLSKELKSDLKEVVEERNMDEMIRPWESFNIEEMTTHMRASRAVKRAREIVARNEVLTAELRNRAQLLENDPNAFFNQ